MGNFNLDITECARAKNRPVAIVVALVDGHAIVSITANVGDLLRRLLAPVEGILR